MADREPADGNEGSPAPGAARAGRPEGLTPLSLSPPLAPAASKPTRLSVFLTASVVALLAFSLYHATLLPGFDFGDTGSFQATVGSPIITPRDGYPLYFAIGGLFLALTGSEPAHALNLASAAEAAIACGLVVITGVELSGSLLAALAAALLFMASYTFWSQAIIAEVYALHMIFVALTMGLALGWSKRPTTGRLALFFAVYALGFGNHLSMILLAPAFTVFFLTAAPGGARTVCTPRVIALAAVCAVAGALQYLWNIRTLWLLPDAPTGVLDAVQRFWFDVTKVDWRETMVMQVPRGVISDHAAMYLFDVRQQFGWIGPALACAGLLQLARTSRTRALLFAVAYLANALFAFGYNVGDTHVFYLPSHLLLALLVAPGLVLVGRLARQPRLVPLLLVAYAGTRAWHEYPALDRSADERPTKVLAALTAGVDDRNGILVADLNWQVQNGLSYFTKATRPEVAVTRMPSVLLYLPALVNDNQAIHRDVFVTERARTAMTAAYGPLLPADRDTRVPIGSVADAARGLPDGTRYALSILKPTRDLSIDWSDVGQALSAETGGRPVHVPDGDYVIIAGLSGREPALVEGSNRPFQRSVVLDGVPLEIRMESWLSADTIRRMGFGHVIANRRHTLIVERGVSFAAFAADGEPIRTAYAANIFAPQPRYLIKPPG